MLGIHQTKSAAGMLPVARASRVPYIAPIERFGLKIMSIGLLVGEADTVMPDPRFAGRIVSQTLLDVRWGQLDYLLVDLPPGTGEPQQSLVEIVALDGAVVVTTPQDLSLLDAGRSLGLFRKAGVPILGVIENMSYLVCPHCGEQIEVFHRSERQWRLAEEAPEQLGRVPMDLAISRGIDSGHPLLQDAPDAAQAAEFRAIAERIAQKMAA
jgi:ATP-binding protein involved in chromosome partitioning